MAANYNRQQLISLRALLDRIVADSPGSEIAMAIVDQEYRRVATLLNDRTVTEVLNPEPPAVVPKAFSWGDVMQTIVGADPLAANTLANKSYISQLPEIKAAINRNDRDSIEFWFAAIGPDMSRPVQEAMQALLGQTEIDPGYQELITQRGDSLVQVEGLPAATAIDVQGALRIV